VRSKPKNRDPPKNTPGNFLRFQFFEKFTLLIIGLTKGVLSWERKEDYYPPPTNLAQNTAIIPG
jgi:hypothetical protein